ncbi:MAG: hypothetical protein D6682_06940 [Zetaproteobacteria bacterium]|nr:MAG: hypothetical protein D6682_06940 [Zetaproteobacteria bacterium]
MPQWGPKWMRFAFAFPVGCLIIQSGMQWLHVRLEWFYGLETFSPAWVAMMLVVPFVAGIAVGVIYGFGGKYLAHFPPLAVLGYAYYESMTHPLPQGVELLPWQLFGFVTILQMELSAFGGVVGELIIRRRIGWDPERKPRWADSEPLPEDDEEERPAE